MEKIINSKVMPLLNRPFMKVMFLIPGIHELICWKIRKKLIKYFGGNIYEVMIGGAPLNKKIEKLLRMVAFRYTIGYGMTECVPMITYSDWKKHHLGSCGKAVLGMEVKV